MSDKYQTRCKGILRGVQFGWNEFNNRETGETTRTPQIVGRFEMLDGDNAGQYETWFGSLSDDMTQKGDKSYYEFTIESLRACGWDGDDLSALPALVEAGNCANEVGLVREHKLVGDKWRSVAKYVNRLGAVKVDLKENAMSDSEIADFSKRMKAKLGGKANGNGGQKQASGQKQTRGAAPPSNRRRNEEPPEDFFPDDAPPYEL